jgi:hypothetical protein
LVSSFGQYVYTTDENGKEVHVYEVDNNGNALYQVDSEGHMLPYTGFLLKYLDANGNVTDTPTVQCTIKKIRLDGNGNPVLDSEGNTTYDDVPVYEKDGVTIRGAKAFGVTDPSNAAKRYFKKNGVGFEKLVEDIINYINSETSQTDSER